LRRADAGQAISSRAAERFIPYLARTQYQPFCCADRRAVVLAVSGGGDSTALVYLTRAWLAATGAAAAPVAVTVDHGLRPGSQAEALAVGAWAAELDTRHLIKRWSGPKPATGLPAAARNARYRLLAEAAAEVGTDLVLTGHTRDDQLETVAMRALRGVGRGLAGMAPATLFAGVTWIVRPLLRASRRELRELLTDAGATWIEDPSNLDPSFKRGRLRRRTGEPPFDGIAAIDDRQGARADLARRAAALIRATCTVLDDAVLEADAELLEAEDRSAAMLALRTLLAVVGGTEQLPAEAAAAAALAALAPGSARATLSRCLIARRGRRVEIAREHRHRADAAGSIGWRSGPWQLFLPSFDLPLAASVAEIAGQTGPPASPFQSHNRG